jgi:3-deoxy-D-manno-octulosonic-acid transferase
MHYFLFIIYNLLGVPFIFIGARIAALFNDKIARGLKGRRALFDHLQQRLATLSPSRPRIWFHISSMGEFEQAKPVIQAVKNRQADTAIVITFFSPSGYDNSLRYALADVISYLPLDSWRNARRFVRMVRPFAMVVIRHDIWLNFQWRLQREGVPSFLIDASMGRRRLRWIRKVRWLVRDVFRTFREIHVISTDNVMPFQVLHPLPACIKVMGDTRFDQVLARTRERDKIKPLLASGLFQRERCVVAGSTWPSDEKVILPALQPWLQASPDHTLVLVPHELNPEHLQMLQDEFVRTGLSFATLSRWLAEPDTRMQVCIVDQMGWLANLYALADLAYVGGSFGPGVHNVLEPAAHGCYVLFGPRNLNSQEAQRLIACGGAQAIAASTDMELVLQRFLSAPAVITQAGAKALALVQENLGASDRIVDRLLDPEPPFLEKRLSTAHPA